MTENVESGGNNYVSSQTYFVNLLWYFTTAFLARHIQMNLILWTFKKKLENLLFLFPSQAGIRNPT